MDTKEILFLNASTKSKFEKILKEKEMLKVLVDKMRKFVDEDKKDQSLIAEINDCYSKMRNK